MCRQSYWNPGTSNRREHYPLGVSKGQKGNSCYLNLVRSINIRTSLIGAMPYGEGKRAVETELLPEEKGVGRKSVPQPCCFPSSLSTSQRKTTGPTKQEPQNKGAQAFSLRGFRLGQRRVRESLGQRGGGKRRNANAHRLSETHTHPFLVI